MVQLLCILTSGLGAHQTSAVSLIAVTQIRLVFLTVVDHGDGKSVALSDDRDGYGRVELAKGHLEAPAVLGS